MMAPPSYARPTTSSTLKTTGTPTKSPGPTTPSKLQPQQLGTLQPTSTPIARKLKRPSALTPRHRQSITYKSDLYPIHPFNPTKPCPLALLPSELRLSIYTYALTHEFATSQPRFILRPGGRGVKYIFPPLLHICRAIRIEVAYVYYTSTPFHFTVRNLDFGCVTGWLDILPLRHRELLSRNKSLKISVIPTLRRSFTYPPKGWLLDKTVDEQWRDCKPYGNVYTLRSEVHRLDFVLFCRLKRWFDLHSTVYRGVTWTYDFGTNLEKKGLFEQVSNGNALCEFLTEQVGLLERAHVVKTWKRGRVGGRGREEAVRFLMDLYAQMEKEVDEDLIDWPWRDGIERLKGVVEWW